MPASRRHGSARKSECSSTPAATAGWAICRSRARGPAPSSSIASRLSRHASDAGPYRPSTSASGHPYGGPRRIHGARYGRDARWRRRGAAGAPTSIRTSWPGSRPGCGRPTTGASRHACSGCSSTRSARRRTSSWPRALAASLLLTRAAAGFARATGDYERFAPDIGRAYRLLGLPADVDVEAVARHELRWWVVRREIGLAAGAAAGDSITDLYAAIYAVPRDDVAEAGRLRGLAAEVRDRGATDDPDGPTGRGARTGREVADLLRGRTGVWRARSPSETRSGSPSGRPGDDR